MAQVTSLGLKEERLPGPSSRIGVRACRLPGPLALSLESGPHTQCAASVSQTIALAKRWAAKDRIHFTLTLSWYLLGGARVLCRSLFHHEKSLAHLTIDSTFAALYVQKRWYSKNEKSCL